MAITVTDEPAVYCVILLTDKSTMHNKTCYVCGLLSYITWANSLLECDELVRFASLGISCMYAPYSIDLGLVGKSDLANNTDSDANRPINL